MDSYFQVRDAERTAWFTSQEVRNIADVAAMVTKALDAAGGEGETSVQALADHGGISLRPISADRFSAQVRDLFCEPPGKLLAELDLKDDTFYCASWVPREEHCVAVSGMISRLLGVYELAMVERLEKHLDLDRFCNEIWDHLHVCAASTRNAWRPKWAGGPGGRKVCGIKPCYHGLRHRPAMRAGDAVSGRFQPPFRIFLEGPMLSLFERCYQICYQAGGKCRSSSSFHGFKCVITANFTKWRLLLNAR